MTRRSSVNQGGTNPRLAAVEAIRRVLAGGESLSRALPAALASLAPQDRALAQELAYGVLRWHLRLAAIVSQLMDKPLKPREQDVAWVLELALYQLLYGRAPDFAVVNEAVEAVRQLGKDWATRLVNGVLRGFMRRQEAVLAAVDGDVVGRFAHPRWLIERLQAAYPEHGQTLLAAANERPPMTLRVNHLRQDTASYRQRLRDAGLDATPHAEVDTALTLAQPVDVARLPGFAEGDVSVQDAAAQLAAGLLAPRAGMAVLDACAAPGGKTAHVLEWARGELDLDAVELNPQRMQRVDETLSRLGLRAHLVVADAVEPRAWWQGRPYDRILLDAPCSATGVIRRHPDIKHHRSPEDVAALVVQQAALLAALWPLLKPGGMLLYVTCSILPEENEQQIAHFLARHEDAEAQALPVSWGIDRGMGRQILPGSGGMDGFFYARLMKR